MKFESYLWSHSTRPFDKLKASLMAGHRKGPSRMGHFPQRVLSYENEVHPVPTGGHFLQRGHRFSNPSFLVSIPDQPAHRARRSVQSPIWFWHRTAGEAKFNGLGFSKWLIVNSF
jgi:hypothetical protein